MSIKVISFDLEGTLVTPDYSQAVWYEGIPLLYARARGIDFAAAKALVEQHYRDVGWQRKEWYDIKFWFERFGLEDYDSLLKEYRQKIAIYPEVDEALSSLSRKYALIIATGTAREFLPYLLDGLERRFAAIFSSISDYGGLKTPEFFSRICREMGIEPAEAVHVGDSWQFDIEAAKAAGIEAYHLDRSGASGDSLRTLAELKPRLGYNS